MKDNPNNQILIIGAGIAGLTAGCYLAKEGFDVILIEKEDKVGGFCASFESCGYEFDVGVHNLAGVKKGVLGKILKELNLDQEIKFNLSDPADTFLVNDLEINIKNSIKDTILELQQKFPSEKESIEIFFKFILQEDYLKIYKSVKNTTFDRLLNNFFKNEIIKKFFNVLLLGHLGVPANLLSAWIAVVWLKDSMPDPGYYPKGGMGGFANCFADKIRFLGGSIAYGNRVRKIEIHDNKIVKLILENERVMRPSLVIANISPTQIFDELIEPEVKDQCYAKRLINSPSAVMMYLGLSCSLDHLWAGKNNTWYVQDKSFDCFSSSYQNYLQELIENIPFLLFFSPGMDGLRQKHSLQIFTLSSYVSKEFWSERKEAFVSRILDCATNLIPNIKENIDMLKVATPLTFKNFSRDETGAILGAAPVLEKQQNYFSNCLTSIDGLLVTGAWCRNGGVAEAAVMGRKAAEIAMRKLQKTWQYGLISLG